MWYAYTGKPLKVYAIFVLSTNMLFDIFFWVILLKNFSKSIPV